MMIFVFIMNEFSVDRFHNNYDRIYRVLRGFDNEGRQGSVSYLSGMHAPALLNDFKDEIIKAVRVNPSDNLVRVGDKSFNEKKVYDVDPDFFSLFSFRLIIGDAATVLKDPGSVVLTESAEFCKHSNKTPSPTIPVAPVSIIFIYLNCDSVVVLPYDPSFLTKLSHTRIYYTIRETHLKTKAIFVDVAL